MSEKVNPQDAENEFVEIYIDEMLAEQPTPRKRHPAAERILRSIATEQYWLGGPVDFARIHRELGTPHPGDDMFEHM